MYEKPFASIRVDFLEEGVKQTAKCNCSYDKFIYFVGLAIKVATDVYQNSIDSVVGDAMKLINNGAIEGFDREG